MLLGICEDYAQDRIHLISLLYRWQEETDIKVDTLEFSHTSDLLSSYKARSADAIFLDIFMPDRNGSLTSLGIDAARTLREEGYRAAIVFVTSSGEYYSEGFEVGAAHYLTKPIDGAAFGEAMNRIVRSAPERYFTVHAGRNNIKIPFNAMIYAEVFNHRTLLHTNFGTVITSMPLRDVEAMLDGDLFLRCFRSYIVNLDGVRQVEDDCLIMKNGARVPVSRREAPAVKQRYLAHCFKGIRRREK